MQSSRMLSLVAVAATESVATARSALWPLAMLRPLPEAPSSTQMPVVLVHGYLGHAAMWRPLIRRLYREGYGDVHTVGYPSTRLRLPQIAERVAQVVEACGEPVLLVGHSLGAVASRAYLKAFGGAKHVHRFVSLGGPHAGTAMFRLAPPNLWDVLDPHGHWVEALAKGPEPVPTVVVRARYDHQVLPPMRAALAGVEEVVLDHQGHNGLLWSRQAHDAVIQALAGA